MALHLILCILACVSGKGLAQGGTPLPTASLDVTPLSGHRNVWVNTAGLMRRADASLAAPASLVAVATSRDIVRHSSSGGSLAPPEAAHSKHVAGHTSSKNPIVLSHNVTTKVSHSKAGSPDEGGTASSNLAGAVVNKIPLNKKMMFVTIWAIVLNAVVTAVVFYLLRPEKVPAPLGDTAQAKAPGAALGAPAMEYPQQQAKTQRGIKGLGRLQ